MRVPSPSKYYVAFAVLIACLVVFVTDRIHPITPKKPNEFREAQKATPIIISKDGSGSGVVVKRTNLYGQTRLFIWTANHVVDDVDVAKVEQRVRNEFRKVGNVSFEAKVILRVPERDLALLWLDAPEGYFDYVKFETTQLDIGAPVYHTGNFLGADNFDGSVSWGRISQLGVKPEGRWPWQSVDQADMVILPGSSGGGLFSSDSRKVVGIVVGWPRMPGVAFYVPVRDMRIEGYEWALYGGGCPRDLLLDKAVKCFKLPEKKDESVSVIILERKPEPPAPKPTAPVAPKKPALRRFTFKGW